MTLEELFNSTKLDVIVSEEVHDLPDMFDVDNWLHSVTSPNQREKAFFDEQLVLFLTVKTPHPGVPPPVDSLVPPAELALFFSHLQVTLDAKYITPQPVHKTLISPVGGINVTPTRSHSYQKATFTSPGTQPSIFPPHTPNPTPQTGESDRQYASTNFSSEGTVLESLVWGETSREEPTGKNFTLLWSDAEKVWVAIYLLTVGVSFLRTSVPEPLLSLTVSTTLRDKPLAMTPGRKELAALLQVAGVITNGGHQSTAATINGIKELEIYKDEMHGLEEVNLLDSLSLGPALGDTGRKPLSFPSTRLGANLRRSAFSLPPVKPMSENLTSPISAATTNVPRVTTSTLRKSFLKTLHTVSGFQIRMKSVFVPYVGIPGHGGDDEERREAGSEERTVVLSVELGNGSSFGGSGSTGFAVEGVDVTIGGEGANSHLIGWGENGSKGSDGIFPLLLGPAEQFNLLYAITFLRQSGADDVAETLCSDANAEKLLSPAGGAEKQRPVAIVIRGRPFDFWKRMRLALDTPHGLAYLTRSFRSRWNCVLDLASVGHSEISEMSSEPPSTQDALPAPPSPFPGLTSNTTSHPLDKSTVAGEHALAGIKRHTISGLSERSQRLHPNARYRNSTPVLNASPSESPISATPISPVTGGKFTPVPPSVILARNSRFASLTTTTNMASPQLGSQSPDIAPRTPAYPAYSTEIIPQTPAGQSPVSNLYFGGTMGHVIDPRRESTVIVANPQTPRPRTSMAHFIDKIASQNGHDVIDPIVVSVALIPPEVASLNQDMIYTLDTFGIEIFVFNLGDRTRRLEVSYPNEKRRRQQTVATVMYPTEESHKVFEQRQAPGILPLENRIRVGPLRPHTCQSVRMQFLALSAGVHSISRLTLTDVESRYSMNLKSVMDVMVHEPDKT